MHHTPAAIICRLSVLQPPHALGTVPAPGQNAVFYPDVLPLLRRASEAAVPVYILTTAETPKVRVRELLIQSYHGDISGLVQCIGQTTPLDFLALAASETGAEPRRLAYFSDVAAEITETAAAGFAAEHVVRPGAAAALPEFIRDFRDVLQPHRHGAGCCS